MTKLVRKKIPFLSRKDMKMFYFKSEKHISQPELIDEMGNIFMDNGEIISNSEYKGKIKRLKI